MSMRQRGFSLVELLVSLGILTIVIVGFLSLFDTSARISRAQSATADVQENLRYVMAELIRVGRMAGCGGVPVMTPISHVMGAVDVQDNVPAGTTVGGLTVIPGTDVLEVRGSFSSPIYDIGAAIGGAFELSGTSGTGTIPSVTVTGDPQDFSGLVAHFTSGGAARLPVTFVTVQRGGLALDNGHSRLLPNYGVAMLTGVAADGSFSFTATASGEDASFIDLNPNGSFPTSLSDVVRMAVIDDLRYFVALDPMTGVPTLYVNNVVTGSNEPLGMDVVDLQVAVGCDYTLTGEIPYVGATAGDDTWLFNNKSGDAESFTDPSPGGASPAVPLVAYLRQLRITLVSRVPAPDRGFAQPAIANEDGRDILSDPSYLGVPASQYRYRSLTDLIRLRSVGPIS